MRQKYWNEKLVFHIICHLSPFMMVKVENKIWGELNKLKTYKKRKKVISKLCKQTLSCKTSLNKHMRIHTLVKPFKCPNCQKCFSDTGNLIAHQRIHSGESPFACMFCQKTFNHSSNLRKHMVIHNGSKPYLCNGCGNIIPTLTAFWLTNGQRTLKKGHINVLNANNFSHPGVI